MNWQPHLHTLVTTGVVDGAGAFTLLPLPPAGVAEELFRRRVIRMLVRRGRIEEDAAAGLLSWYPGGANPRPARWGEPPDKRAREEPANLGSGDRRPLGPMRTAPVARRVIEF